jgi:diphthine-ammonia ligase
MALYRAIQAGAKPAYLLTMLREDGKRSRSHGIPPTILERQAISLGIPLITRNATWEEYEPVFTATLKELREEGVRMGVFGDIDMDEHREWEEMVCGKAGMEAHLPIWHTPRRELIESFLGVGFEAIIVACNDEKMGSHYLGRAVTLDLIGEFEEMGIDPAGEEGEYHTVVIDGPIFKLPIQLNYGEKELHSGYWFLEVSVK